MPYGRYRYSYLVLRLGLAAVFLWIGIDIVRHPDAWIGYLPSSLPFNLTRELALRLNAVVDMAIGILLLAGRLRRLTSLLAVLHLLGIIVVHGIDQVIIRDVGLLGAALALLLWPQSHHRKPWWRRLLRRRRPEYDEEA